MPADDPRPSSQPRFWDERFADRNGLFGRAPNAFAAAEVDRIPRGGDVVELGAGEGRTLLWLAAERDARCTAVDFSAEALATAAQWADEANRPLHTVEADVRTWQPGRQWDAVVVTFLQLLPDERPGLYRTIRRCLRPGGLVVGEWFRPDHLTGDYDRLGPSTADRMVPPSELRAAFAEDEILTCESADVTLDEGPVLRGSAAVVRLLARRTGAPPPAQ